MIMKYNNTDVLYIIIIRLVYCHYDNCVVTMTYKVY